MNVRDISLGVFTGIIVTLAWWCSHFVAPAMALSILPSMATTTCLWLSMSALKTWRVVFSHALAAAIAASTWFFIHDTVNDAAVSLLVTVTIVAILTTGWLRHAPAVATAAACAMHPDKLPQLAMAIAIQLLVITIGVHLVQRLQKRLIKH
jgi:hypothetical protein